MSRNRFELLLSNLHFANNDTIDQNERLGKVLQLLKEMTENYQKVYTPGENIVIDGTMVFGGEDWYSDNTYLQNHISTE